MTAPLNRILCIHRVTLKTKTFCHEWTWYSSLGGPEEVISSEKDSTSCEERESHQVTSKQFPGKYQRNKKSDNQKFVEWWNAGIIF